MNVEVGEKTTSPNISYDFVPELVRNCDNLRAEFQNGDAEMEVDYKNIFRDDINFLFHLKECFKYYEEHQKFPAKI